MMVIARKCWDVLAKKTEETLTAQQVALTAVKSRHQQLLQDQQNLIRMMEQYQLQAQEQLRQLRSVSDAANFSSFLNQLQTLLNKVQADLQAEELNVKRAKAKLDVAHQEHQKMTALQEQDRHKVQAWKDKQEQKEMDRLGLTLHQLRR
jgi:flagellar export protein FliJ